MTGNGTQKPLDQDGYFAAAILVARMEDAALDRAPVWDDVASFDGRPWRSAVDIVTAGYPCQPFSVAGKRRGADDPRHLWPHVARVIGETEPPFVFLENVAHHLRLGFPEVACGLVGMGYRLAAGLFTAAEVGAPHKRERLFILAIREGDELADPARLLRDPLEWRQPDGDAAALADADGERCLQAERGQPKDGRSDPFRRVVDDADGARSQGRGDEPRQHAGERPAWPPDGVDAALPRRQRHVPRSWCLVPREEKEASMEKAIIIGVDLAKHSFQLHGAAADGTVLFRKKLSRPQFHRFMSEQPGCTVVMEACGGAHYWARELARLGHVTRLISARYVKPFIKRQKNDAADAEAIVEAATRPSMRFVEVKNAEQQARAVVFRTREQLVKQRTELVNALRSHLYEFGYVAPQGIHQLRRIEEILDDDGTDLPQLARETCRDLLSQIAAQTARIDVLMKRIGELARTAETTRRLQTMPGIGPIGALAIETFAPPMETFGCGRNFAAWLGLVPRQNSTGGKQRLGRTSKMGQQDIRRLLIIGAMAVVRWTSQKGARPGTWLARMLATKPRMLVAVALANKMARGIWAMLTRNENYRDPGQLMAA